MYRYLIIYILETNFNSSFKIRYYTIGLYLTLTSLINTNFTKKTQMFKKLSIVLLIAIISITTYARTILLDNISPYSATSPIENTSLKDMEKAIRGACVQLKWKECKVIEPDHIEATLNVRTHSLVVNIFIPKNILLTTKLCVLTFKVENSMWSFYNFTLLPSLAEHMLPELLFPYLLKRCFLLGMLPNKD